MTGDSFAWVPAMLCRCCYRKRSLVFVSVFVCVARSQVVAQQQQLITREHNARLSIGRHFVGTGGQMVSALVPVDTSETAAAAAVATANAVITCTPPGETMLQDAPYGASDPSAQHRLNSDHDDDSADAEVDVVRLNWRRFANTRPKSSGGQVEGAVRLRELAASA